MLGLQMEVNNTVRASSIYFRGVLLLFVPSLCVPSLCVPFVENRLIV